MTFYYHFTLSVKKNHQESALTQNLISLYTLSIQSQEPHADYLKIKDLVLPIASASSLKHFFKTPKAEKSHHKDLFK